MDFYKLALTCLFCFFFIISYLIIQSIKVEVIFKQNSTWQIRIFQIFVSMLSGFFLAYVVTELIKAFQI